MRSHVRPLGLSLLLLLVVSLPATAQEWTFIRGDFNADGGLGLPDAIGILNYLFAGGQPPICQDAADVTDSGNIGLASAIYLLNFLFVSGPPPPPPYPDCGEDPTADSYDCEGPVTGCPPATGPPTFTSNPFTVGNVEYPYAYDVDAEDPQQEDIVYSLETAPPGAAIDALTGSITWLPALGQEGPHPFVVRATNESDLFAEQAFTVTIQAWPGAPTVDAVPSPTTETTVVLSGTATAAAEVEISGGAAIVTTPVVGNAFSAPVDLNPNSTNHLRVRAINGVGQASAPTVITVIQDQQAPELFIDAPADDSETIAGSVFVSGRVSDMLSGFMGMTVTVNGVATEVEPGIGTNGTYVTTDPVPLTLGSNTLTAVATDTVGNATSVTSTVVRIALDPTLPQIQVIAGNDQTGAVRTTLASPIAVQVNDSDGSPFANKLVSFRVVRSDGRLRAIAAPPGSGALLYQTFTDAAGQAQAWWTLGTDAGCGNNRVEVVTGGTQARAELCASATEGPPIQINIGTGSTQKGEVGGPAPEPLVAWVSDSCNGVSGVPVTFTVVQGNGLVEGQSSVTVPSGLAGRAQVEFTLGSDPGVNLVEATTASNQGQPAVFLITGIERDETLPTSFSGRVLTNAGEPVTGATCVLTVGAQPNLVALTDANGSFTFEDTVSAGPAGLFVHGVSAYAVNGEPTPTGTFPSLHFEPILVPNGANTPVEPIRLPRLVDSNVAVYSTTQDTVLVAEGIAGLRMTIAAGSMRYPSGDLAPDGAVVSLNIVHHDDIPMAMPDGAAPPFAWTLQPGGATFDPPVRIEYPNMSSLPAGAVAYFLTFNHDTGKFEIIASGTVTPDGSRIVTDPGDGLSLAGWGCECPPYSVTGDCISCTKICTDGGFLSGGTVSVNTATPEYGEVLVFSASGIVDSGGEREKICDDGSVTTLSIPPGDIFYTNVITPPSGLPILGIGDEAFIEADQCGTYTCTFYASVSRPCAPADVEVGSVSATVDGPVLADPTLLPTFDANLSGLSGVLSILEFVSGIPGSPCSFSPPDLEIPVAREEFEQCCSDGSTQFLERWNGALIQPFGFSCAFPIFGVPLVVSVDATLGMDGIVFINVSGEQDCMDPQICGVWTITVTGSAGLVIEVGPAGILGSGSGQIVIASGGNGEVCFEDMASPPTYTGEFCVFQANLVGTITLLSFEIASINTTIWTGDCASP